MAFTGKYNKFKRAGLLSFFNLTSPFSLQSRLVEATVSIKDSIFNVIYWLTHPSFE